MAARKTPARAGTKARRQGPAAAAETTTTSQGPEAVPATRSGGRKASTKGTASTSRTRGRPRVSNTDTDRVTLRIEQEHLQMIDMLVQLKQYSNRSDAIRQAIKDFCDSHLEEVDSLIERQQKKQKLAQLAALTQQLADLREQ